MVASEFTQPHICETENTGVRLLAMEADASQSGGIIVAVLIIFSLCAHHKHIVMLFADDYQDSRAQKWPLLQLKRLCCFLLESCQSY